MTTVIEKKTGKELYGTHFEFIDTDTEIGVSEMRTEEMENPHFDFKTRKYYDNI